MQFDPFSEGFFDDPMPVYRWLRDESPVHYLEEFDSFFLSRFHDIWEATVLFAADRFRSSIGGTMAVHVPDPGSAIALSAESR